MNEYDLPPCLIYIDNDGRWFHKGAEIIRRDIVRLFYQHMEMDARGQYIISWRGERCYVEVEDTPFVVWRATFDHHEPSGPPGFTLLLSDDSRERLAPDTLYIGDKNVLYCRVKNSAFPARFGRNAYYQLADYIQEEDGRFYLPLKGEKYFVTQKGNDASA